MPRKRHPILLVFLLVACLCLTACPLAAQAQPVVLNAFSAVDGSFGLRPMSHACLGLRLPGRVLSALPEGGVQFRFGAASLRWFVEAEPDPGRLYCLGQDLWYGE